MKNKTFQFDFLQFFYYVENESGSMEERLLDFEPLFKEISQNDLKKTIRNIDNEEHRFQVCTLDDTCGFWEVQLLRQREEIIPGISYEDGSYELITLPEGQYLAESSTILYDRKTSLLLFQRNRYGYSINALLNYIRTF